MSFSICREQSDLYCLDIIIGELRETHYFNFNLIPSFSFIDHLSFRLLLPLFSGLDNPGSDNTMAECTEL